MSEGSLGYLVLVESYGFGTLGIGLTRVSKQNHVAYMLALFEGCYMVLPLER